MCFHFIEEKIVLLKMKLNHPSISTGQCNQLVPLLTSAPWMPKSQRDIKIHEVLKRYAHTIQ
jgi:hypothetical protein